MISFSDIKLLFSGIGKVRSAAKLMGEIASLNERVSELERKNSHSGPLVCAECGHVPVRIETILWTNQFGTKMQTVRRVCPTCNVIKARDESIGQA